MANKIDFSSIRHIKVHKEQFDVIEEKASAVIVECKEDGRCVSFTRLKSEKHMTKTLTIEYEVFEEENITVLSVVENDTVLKMFEGKEADDVYRLLVEQKG